MGTERRVEQRESGLWETAWYLVDCGGEEQRGIQVLSGREAGRRNRFGGS